MSWGWAKQAAAGAAFVLMILTLHRRDGGRAGTAPKPGRCYFG